MFKIPCNVYMILIRIWESLFNILLIRRKLLVFFILTQWVWIISLCSKSLSTLTVFIKQIIIISEKLSLNHPLTKDIFLSFHCQAAFICKGNILTAVFDNMHIWCLANSGNDSVQTPWEGRCGLCLGLFKARRSLLCLYHCRTSLEHLDRLWNGYMLYKQGIVGQFLFQCNYILHIISTTYHFFTMTSNRNQSKWTLFYYKLGLFVV